MVVTDIPFEIPNKFEHRYSLLDCRDKNENRVMENAEQRINIMRDEDKKLNFLRNGVYKSKHHKLYPKRTFFTCSAFNLVKLSAEVKREQEQHDKTMKVIETHIRQEKQNERQMKQLRGSVIKNQHAIRRALKDYEAVIKRKIQQTDGELTEAKDTWFQLKQDDMHRKEALTKSHIRTAQLVDQSDKYLRRTIDIRKSQDMRHYQEKVEELKFCRSERDRLVQNFQHKLRLQEEAENQVRQQVAELALLLNKNNLNASLENAENQRLWKAEAASNTLNELNTEKDITDKLLTLRSNYGKAENDKLRMDESLGYTKLSLAFGDRIQQRKLTDIQRDIHDNDHRQLSLQQNVINERLNKNLKDLNLSIKEHGLRRQSQIESSLKQKRDNYLSREGRFGSRAKKRLNEMRRDMLKDSMQHYQKSVDGNRKRERWLFRDIQSASSTRQRQVSLVRLLSAELAQTKRYNAAKLKAISMKMQQEETDLQRHLQRETSQLNRIQTGRQEKCGRLLKHRSIMERDQHALDEQEKEHDRLARIASHLPID